MKYDFTIIGSGIIGLTLAFKLKQKFKFNININKMVSKKIWGPHLWYSMHFIALGFPLDASNIDRTNYKNFYINLPNVIPCEECSKHFAKNLNNYNINEIIKIIN